MLYEFTVIPRFMLQWVAKNGDLNRMMTQIEVRRNKKLDNVIRSNFNRGDVNRRLTVHISV